MPDERVRLAYILASSHSGSTLLAMLLGAHPDISTVGELKVTSLGDPDQYRCSCLARIKECPFWTEIAQDMAKRGFQFEITNAGTDIRSGASPYVRRLLRPLSRGPVFEVMRDLALFLSPTWRKSLPRRQALNQALMACVLARTGRSVIVDSSKTGLRLKYLLRNPALDIRVIRLIRDGRGVSLTYVDPARFADARDPGLRGGGTGTSPKPTRLSMAAAAREWRRSNEEAESIVRRLPSAQWTEVRYEQLCEQPDATLRRLHEFLAVAPRALPADFRSGCHHVIGNGMRLDSHTVIELDERWRTQLSEADLRVFHLVAGTMNRRLGYVNAGERGQVDPGQ